MIQLPRRDRTRVAPSDEGDHGKSLVLVAFVPAGIAAACAVVAALFTLVTAGGALSGVFGAVGGMWMAIHQAPVYIGDLELGAMPLLPTALLMAGVARYTSRVVSADDPVSRHLAVVGSAVGGPALATVVALAIIQDASASTAVSTIGAIPAILVVVVVHAVAAVVGIGWKSLGRYVTEWGLPSALPSVLRGGALALGTVLATGALLVVVGAFTGWARIQDVFATEPSIVGKVGLLLLSILYLPNVVVGAAAALVGTTAHVGVADYSLFAAHPGPLPAVPVLGVVPDTPISALWSLGLIVTAAAAIWFSVRTRAEGRTMSERLRYAVSVAAIAAAGALVLGFLAGGTMGVFDSIGVEAPMFALAVLGWYAAAGMILVLVRERSDAWGLPSVAVGLRDVRSLPAIFRRRSGGPDPSGEGGGAAADGAEPGDLDAADADKLEADLDSHLGSDLVDGR